MQCSYLLIVLRHFNASLDYYKAIYPDGISDYVIKVDFDGAQVRWCSDGAFVSRFLKKLQVIVILI